MLTLEFERGRVGSLCCDGCRKTLWTELMHLWPIRFSLRSRLRFAETWLRQRLLPPVLAPGAMPFFTLSYLCMLFLPVLLGASATLHWPQTLVSVALFLPIYFHFYWARGWRRVALLLIVAALGVVLMPYNLFSHTYLIYAAVLAAYLPWRQMLLVFVISEVSFVGVMLLHGVPLVPALAMSLISGGMAALGNRMWLNYASKNVALRLSQEEMGRMAAMAERERIGRDLHDLLGHTLSVIALKSELAGRLIDRDVVAARREIDEVKRVARDALSEVRRAVSGMRSHGVLAECANARVALASVQVHFEYKTEAPTMVPEVESVLAFILREATTNVIRHAQAHRCRVHFQLLEDRVQMEFLDDGRGGIRAEGNGIAGIRERIAELGGTLVLNSPKGAGTRLLVEVPAEVEPDVVLGLHTTQKLRLAAVR